jgi:cysteine desulfurase / selenocysteine lyase
MNREDFPMLAQTMHGKPLVYLDTAATAQKPRQVIEAIANFYTSNYGTVHRAVYTLAVHATDQYQKTRQRVRAFLNARKDEEIIYTKGTTEAINLVASSFGKAFIQDGDEIILTEIEHHSNIVPWQLLGAKLRIIPVNDKGELKLDVLDQLLGPKTKMVAVGHISNALGTENPVKELIQRVRKASNAKVLIDGAQAAPHMRVDVQDLDADFYVFSGHKLYGPTGIGILYGKEELLDKMPPYQGGGDMIERVTFEKTTYNALPMKFEAGTPMIAEVMGLSAAIDYVTHIGLERIYEHEMALHRYAEEQMRAIPGLQIIGQAEKKGAITSFIVKGIHPLDIGTMLDLKGFAVRTGHHCAQPAMHRFGIEGTARASFGLYNTFEEVDRFVQALHEVIAMLK